MDQIFEGYSTYWSGYNNKCLVIVLEEKHDNNYPMVALITQNLDGEGEDNYDMILALMKYQNYHINLMYPFDIYDEYGYKSDGSKFIGNLEEIKIEINRIKNLLSSNNII